MKSSVQGSDERGLYRVRLVVDLVSDFFELPVVDDERMDNVSSLSS